MLWPFCALRAQLPGFGSMPVDIKADQTHFENGVAIAEGNLVIQYGEVTINADYGQYHPDTHDVLVLGHVRIYRQGQIFVGERAVFNLETKQLHAANFRGDFYPFRFSADSISTLGPNAYVVRNGEFTTSDSSKPDYTMHAKSARVYANDRVIMRDVTLYVGNTPVFWFPYLYQPLRKDMGYEIRPGYYSTWGFFLLTSYDFPISDDWKGVLHLDYRNKQGEAIGFDSDYRFGEDNRSWGRFRSYYADDQLPPTIKTNGKSQKVNSDRYRVSVQDRVYLSDNLWANVDINKLSDVRFLRDFEPQEYRVDPQPDNVLSLTQWNPNYTGSLIYRDQINKFYGTTERLPELVVDANRQSVANSNFFYDGETGYANLRRAFAAGSTTQDYRYWRFDSYHEIVYPMFLWNFLSLVPRAGVRGTYYSQTGSFQMQTQDIVVDQLLPNNSFLRTTQTTTINKFYSHAALFRGVIDGGFEASFKFSRAYDSVESRALGLDDLRHVVQPYMDLSLAYSTANPNRILQIDRFQPSTQLPLYEFPEFTGVDTISTWAVAQLGVRNRLETKRDNLSFNWLELDTFTDVNIKEPTFATGGYHQGTLSNLYNNLTFRPVPWAGLAVQAQTPLNSRGFTDIETNATFMPGRDVRLTLGHEYISHNPFFVNSSLVNTSIYYRVNDNWGVSAREDYEFTNSTLVEQVYQLHRDLSSWVASLGLQVENNGPGRSPQMLYAVLFTMTLKDMPQLTTPFNFDPSSIGSKNP